jgi:HPt (histidine-containing phosphotransfer) domain-containing protein
VQIHDLQKRLGDLHCGDVSALKRANHTLAQHARSLNVEMRDLTRAAARLERIKEELSGAAGASEVRDMPCSALSTISNADHLLLGRSPCLHMQRQAQL